MRIRIEETQDLSQWPSIRVPRLAVVFLLAHSDEF